MRPIVFALALAGCGGHEPGALGGNAEAGKKLLHEYGCAACHTIPGVSAARGNVGPPLDRLASRVYLFGSLPNTPANLAHLIRHPQKVDPRTAMPDMQVSEAHARDMVAYLGTLR